jgi:hypothetical protein
MLFVFGGLMPPFCQPPCGSHLLYRYDFLGALGVCEVFAGRGEDFALWRGIYYIYSSIALMA